jgi:hypothetical protein
MKKIVNCCLALLVGLTLLHSSTALAGFSNVSITHVHVAGNTTAYAVVQVSAISGSPASCAVYPQVAMYIDLSTNKGRAVLSVATAAMLAGKKVSIWGTGTCGTPSGLAAEELIDRITVSN